MHSKDFAFNMPKKQLNLLTTFLHIEERNIFKIDNYVIFSTFYQNFNLFLS